MFLSYAHTDNAIRQELQVHLSPLRRQGLILDWTDRQIGPGENWPDAITAHLERADLILLLISPAFIASDYAYGKELQRALEMHDAGCARVIPVIVRPCLWTKLPFAKLQALPDGGNPITVWSNADLAYLSVVEGVEAAATELLKDEGNPVSEWITSLLLRRKVVRLVQTILRERSIYNGPVDGEPANLRLRDALRQFQASAGIAADGLIGPDTLRALIVERNSSGAIIG